MKYKSSICGLHVCSGIHGAPLAAIPASFPVCMGLGILRFYYYEKKSHNSVCGGLLVQLLFGHSRYFTRALRINSPMGLSANGIGGNLFGRIHLLLTQYKPPTRRICP